MKSKVRNGLTLAMMAASVCLVSCSDDNEPNLPAQGVEVNNAELKSILQQMGYQFDEQGLLIQDDKVKQTTTLDLSGKKLTHFEGLEVFPNLTELNLSNNEYGPVFDLSTLPQQIKGINLTGNPIYDLEGLVETSIANDEVTTKILHGFTKLYLPETAKWNVEDLMPFYTQNKAEKTEVDMKIEDKKGDLQPYTTLREIPDAKLREYLKKIYGSLFTGDGTQIDISKPLSLNERGNAIIIDSENAAGIQSAEGIEYFINNPYYPTFYVSVSLQTPYTAGYMMPRANVKGVTLNQINTPLGIDLSEANKLATISLRHNEGITALDLSNTLFLGEDELDPSTPNSLVCTDCEKLNEIKFPKSTKGLTGKIQLSNLKGLKKVDLSLVKGAGELALHQLPQCELTYPEDLQYGYDSKEGKFLSFEKGGKLDFSVSKDVLDKAQTAPFIEKYTDYMNDSWVKYSDYEAVSWKKGDAESMKGEYKGAFTTVLMNGEDKGQVPDMTTTVSSNNPETINLNVAPFKIGKMPFNISIDAKEIKLTEEGTFNQDCQEAIVAEGLPMKFGAKIEGSIAGNHLKYTMTATPLPGMDIKVVFEGDK